MPVVTLHHGDCLDLLSGLPAGSVDAVVTDPPYELGFMNARWDATGEAFRPETWRAVLRTLKAGGYMLAFGGTRTYHRITCAIEDAGFEIRDCLMWLFGQGFPKAKSCLKPGYEPIVLARKPGKKVLPLQIDHCRIGTGGQLKWERPRGMGFSGETNNGACQRMRADSGRWPSNVMLDEAAAAQLDAQSGTLKSGKGGVRGTRTSRIYGAESRSADCLIKGYGDPGGASRFFYCAKASRRDRDEGLVDRNIHITVKPTNLMRWLCHLVTLPGGTVLDPFMGSGSTGKAARLEGLSFIGIERHKPYFDIARRRIAEAGQVRIKKGVA